LGLDAQAAGDADQGERGLGTGAGDLEGRGAPGLGERAVGQEGAAPGGDRVAATSGDDRGRQAAHRSAALVEQAGLARERLAVLAMRAILSWPSTTLPSGPNPLC